MILQGDCLSVLKTLPENSVQCVVTSPPYFSLRDYGVPASIWGGDPQHAHVWEGIERQAERYTGKRKWQHIGEEAQAAGVKVRDVDPNAWGHPKTTDTAFCSCGAWQGALGLEPTPELFVEHMVLVFREVKRVLRKDGTLWFNMGDSYAAGGKGGGGSFMQERKDAAWQKRSLLNGWRSAPPGLKSKDLLGVPWMCAFALRSDGWYLRSDIIWHKPNPMPESIKDRPTKSHEYLFLFSKSSRYHYDAEAIREPYAESTLREIEQGYTGEALKDYEGAGVQNPSETKRRIIEGARRKNEQSGDRRKEGFNDRWDADYNGKHASTDPQAAGRRLQQNTKRLRDAGAPHGNPFVDVGRNKRTVWSIPTAPFAEAHFATFPEELVDPCIRAGCPQGGSVLDPFSGAGTVGVVCQKLQRQFIGIELNPEYIAMAERRIAAVAPLFGEATA